MRDKARPGSSLLSTEHGAPVGHGGGRVGNTEDEDKVGSALHCGGCRGGQSLLLIICSNYNNLASNKERSYLLL